MINILSPGPSLQTELNKATDPRVLRQAHKAEPPAPDPLLPCYYRAPLIVPRVNYDPDQSAVVYHARAVYEKRGQLADYIMRQSTQTETWRWKIFALMNSLAKTQMQITKAQLYKDKHTYLAYFLAMPS